MAIDAFFVIRWVYFFFCIMSVVSGSDKYTYRGCYSDSTDLKDKVSTPATLTLDGCAGMCQLSGYPYAGLQEGRLCYCGQIYDVIGKSINGACNMTCGSDNARCGGHLANDVYYTVDSSGQLSKSFVLTKSPSAFRVARMKCVSDNGDLVCPTDSNINNQLIASVANDSSITKVWIGLYRNDISNSNSTSYEWTDETLSKFKLSSSSYSSYWADGEKQLNPCVSLDVRSGKWQSTDCNTALPFFCKQPPVAQGDDTTDPTDVGSDGSSDGVGSDSKRLALFIVLPLFILCYGGSCILYCVHKIIKNCNRKKHSKMMLPSADDAQKNRIPGAVPPAGAREKIPNQQTPPYRLLSAAKRVTVYPAPQTATALPLPSKFPMYMDMGSKMKSSAEEMPGKEPALGDATARSVKIAMPEDGPDQSPPPKYVDRQEEKRARLLENAARESRMRREKEMEEGRPTSRPFTAPKRQPPPPAPEEDTASDKHGSTTNLLGKPEKDETPEAGAGGSGQPQSMAGMSINEILKMKVAQKADKKRPRKIVAA